jgi:hypothetical protein
MVHEHLNDLAVLNISKDVIEDIPSCNQKLIEFFASQQNQRGQFPYM